MLKKFHCFNKNTDFSLIVEEILANDANYLTINSFLIYSKVLLT